MKEEINRLVNCPVLTAADEYILDNIDKTKLAEWIDFLRSYRKVMWRDNDTGELVSYEELRKRNCRVQPLPEYPEQLMEMGEFFCNLLQNRPEFILDLRDVGFFTEGSLVLLWTGTMWSAALIANLIFDAYHRDRFCDGLFGSGVDNGLYLKALLHLEDLIAFYRTTKKQSSH